MSARAQVRTGFLWLLAVGLLLLVGWGATKELSELTALPEAPVEITVAELGTVDRLAWVSVPDGYPACEGAIWHQNDEYVPLVDTAGSAVGVVQLDDDQLCATLPVPVTGSLRHARDMPEAHFTKLAVERGLTLQARHVLRAELDVPGAKQKTAVTLLGVALALAVGMAVVALGWWRKRRNAIEGASSGEHTSTAIPGAHDAIGSMARALAASPDDPVLPRGALRLTEQAVTRARRARQLGAPLFALLALGALGGVGTSGFGILHDVKVWKEGVPVQAEAKGTVTRYQAIVVGTDYSAAWLAPGDTSPEPRIHHGKGSYWTLFVGPGQDLGDVHVLESDPESFTVSSAAELWPWRAVIPLFWLLLVGLFGAASVSTWRNADKVARIAADPVQARFGVVNVTENRVNGATTGYTVQGYVDGESRKFHLARDQAPEQLLVIDDEGGVLAVHERGNPKNFVLVLDDLSPFALTGQERARVQAVLHARGSDTTLRG